MIVSKAVEERDMLCEEDKELVDNIYRFLLVDVGISVGKVSLPTFFKEMELRDASNAVISTGSILRSVDMYTRERDSKKKKVQKAEIKSMLRKVPKDMPTEFATLIKEAGALL